MDTFVLKNGYKILTLITVSLPYTQNETKLQNKSQDGDLSVLKSHLDRSEFKSGEEEVLWTKVSVKMYPSE